MNVSPNFYKNDSMSDFDIITTIVQSRQPAMFGELYNRYYAKVYAKTLSLVKSPADAEDITQDVFSKAFLNLAKFEGRASFSTWLYRITFNETMDFFRKNKNKNHSLQEVVVEVEDVAEGKLLDKLFREKLLNQLIHVLDELEDPEKSIITMKYLEDYSIKDIMAVYSISESATKMRLKRAKDKLQKKYQDQFELVY